MSKKAQNSALSNPVSATAVDATEARRQDTLLKAGALQSAIFNSASFPSIATDAKGVIQIFNVIATSETSSPNWSSWVSSGASPPRSHPIWR